MYVIYNFFSLINCFYNLTNKPQVIFVCIFVLIFKIYPPKVIHKYINILVFSTTRTIKFLRILFDK